MTQALQAYDCLDVRVLPLYDQGTTLVEGMVVEGRPNTGTGRRQRVMSFFADPAASAGIDIIIGTHSQTVSLDQDGIFNATFPALLTSGSMELRAHTGQQVFFQRPFSLPASPSFLLISDIDDTVLVSDVTHKVRLLLKTLFKNVKGRKPVDGTPALYQELATKSPQGIPLTVFLSASPSTLSRFLHTFLDQNGFPDRIICLKRSLQAEGFKARDHKMKWLKRLHTLYPTLPLFLLGDSGEQDPEIYADFLESEKPRCLGVVIRSLDEALSQSRWTTILQRLQKDHIPFFLWHAMPVLRDQLQKALFLPSSNSK